MLSDTTIMVKQVLEKKGFSFVYTIQLTTTIVYTNIRVKKLFSHFIQEVGQLGIFFIGQLRFMFAMILIHLFFFPLHQFKPLFLDTNIKLATVLLANFPIYQPFQPSIFS